MLDMVLTAQFFWVLCFIRNRGVHKALVYSGGTVASAYVAVQLLDWLSRLFTTQSNPVFRWLESQITTATEKVGAVSHFVPPEPALAGGFHASWVALHIVRGLLFVVITAAVFLLFYVLSFLLDALWDRPERVYRRRHVWLSTVLGVACGIYVVVITGVFIGNLAWLNEMSFLTGEVNHSLGMMWIGRLVTETMLHFQFFT